MELSTHIDAITADLGALGAMGDEQARLAAERLIRALEPSLRLHLLDVLSEAADELDPQLRSGRVDVRLSGGDVTLLYIEDPSASTQAQSPGDDDLAARITLRLPDRLKAAAEAAAAGEGLSLNAWLIRSVKIALDRRPPGRGLKGFARS